MKHFYFDDNWTFRRGLLDSVGILDSDPGITVNLPHDGTISKDVDKNAPAAYDSGYYPGDICSYTKYFMVPFEWEDDCVELKFDGAMIHAEVEVNGCKVAEHHYGYSPFCVDITEYVTFGAENRISINLNTGIQPASRWYTGSGLFRSVALLHGPKLHIPSDGLYLITKEVADNMAFIEAKVEVANSSLRDRIAEVDVELIEESSGKESAFSKAKVFIKAGSTAEARLNIIVKDPLLWDCDTPNLYIVRAKTTDLGVYRTHLNKNDDEYTDEATALFGIRTITADAIRGLRINGKSIKLKGGCIHHDNGLLGAVSLYESEARKISKLKSVGFNAIRTAHNPPSAALVEACDRLGMYIFDEAFDAWGIAKRPGDYSQHFETRWKSDLTAFVKRDRIHPSVIMWSTGNEIPERGGLNKGYKIAAELADTIRTLDPTRPISNGVCSLWSGLDDYLARSQNQQQNANLSKIENLWEDATEPFTNCLDIVGYNYMEDQYEKDHEMFPDRVILGSENFPQQIGYRWPMVEALPYVIGDFTWTAWDYLGEAGIGKAAYVDESDPLVKQGPWALMPQTASPYPWRTANDADFDITGRMTPQGAYRSVVWGSKSTYLFSHHPANFGKVEILSPWGFTGVIKNWNYSGYEGSPVELVVFSNAEEVELIINGKVIERKKVSSDRPMPNTVHFKTDFVSGTVEAVSYSDGKEISRDCMITSGSAAALRLNLSKDCLDADGLDAVYIDIDVVDSEGNVVTDAAVNLTAQVSGAAVLAGFGTGTPCTDENYSDNKTTTFRGHATAILRSSNEIGETEFIVSADGLPDSACSVVSL